MKNINSKWNRDNKGQWWYTMGAKKVRTRGEERKCGHCGESFLHALFQSKNKPKRGKFCSTECATKALGGHRNKTGEKSHLWRGGRSIIRGGYVEIYAPEHPKARGGKYVREHRLVMEKHLGRYLEDHEQVHHKNAIKDDNRLENLELMTSKVHIGKVECPHCKVTFVIK